MRDADRTAGLISQRGGARTRVVVNRVRGDYVKRGLQYPPATVAASLDAKLLCAVPEDEEILQCTLQRVLPLRGSGEGAEGAFAHRRPNAGRSGISARKRRDYSRA